MTGESAVQDDERARRERDILMNLSAFRREFVVEHPEWDDDFVMRGYLPPEYASWNKPAPGATVTPIADAPSAPASTPRFDAMAEERVADWRPQSLDTVLDALVAGTLQPVVPEVGQVQVPDGEPARGLLYEGRVNGIAGESGGGKSWIALAIGVEQMQAGRRFTYLDFEDSMTTAVMRLVTLGCPIDVIRSRFAYVHPDTHSDEGVQALVDSIEAGAYVVVDSTGEALAAAGLKQNADEDVASWFAKLPKPLGEAGATVLLLDHMVKSEDGGLWPIGSQRKRAAITGVQYIVKTLAGQAPSTSSDGRAMLVVAKDRHGAYEVGSTASVVSFTHPGTATTEPDGTLTWTTSDLLHVTFGIGKTPAQVEREKADRFDDDVARMARLNPPSKRKAREVFGGRAAHADAVYDAWKKLPND